MSDETGEIKKMSEELAVKTKEDEIVVDITGEEKPSDEQVNTFNIDDVPSYDNTSTVILTDKSTTEEEEFKKPTQTLSCWNCEGNHNMVDCTKKRNVRVIARNRNIFMKGKTTISNVRYHKDIEQKYADIKPGAYSDKLKDALGIGDWQAPEFVYRMRVLGYPPGWLKEAEVHRAEVSLIDGDGSAVSHPEDEEGEVDSPCIKYEPDKLISYSGFNVPLEADIEDEGQYYDCPPMQFCHSRSEFERIMKTNRAAKYKRKSLQQQTLSPKRVKILNDEMEQVNPPQSIENLTPSPEEKFQKIDSNDKNESKDTSIELESNMDTTIDLSSDVENTTKVMDVSATSVVEVDSPIKHLQSTPLTTNSVSPLVTSTPLQQNDTPITPMVNRSIHHRSLSKSFNLGVGIPGVITPMRTPTADKWSVGISGHIDFDNIPDSTGKWDKINKIMGKVRLQMSQLNDEDNEIS